MVMSPGGRRRKILTEAPSGFRAWRHFTGPSPRRYDRAVLDGVRLGLGCLRLPEGERGVAVVRAALDAGVRLVDTADMYGPAPGDGERIVAAAVAGRSVVVVTKVGLTRPEPG